MQESIECGKIGDFLKKLTGGLSKVIETISDAGIKIANQDANSGNTQLQITDTKQDSKGNVVTTAKCNGHDVIITIRPAESEEEGLVDLIVAFDQGKPYEHLDLNSDDIINDSGSVQQLITADITDFFKLFSSKKIHVKLQKIVSDTGIDIDLKAIKSDYDYDYAMNILDTVLDDDTFIEEIPEDDAWYTIDEIDDEYTIDESEPFDESECLKIAIHYCKEAIDNIHNIIWYASLNHLEIDFENAYDTLDALNEDFTNIGEYLYSGDTDTEDCSFLSTYINIDLGAFTEQELEDTITEYINTYTNALKYCIACYADSEDLQVILDDWC